jgi:tetratricopeptide (TPR) repeat protein
MAAGYLEEAEQNFRSAVGRAKIFQDPLLIAQSRTNLAEVFLEREKLEEAATLLDEAKSGIENEDAARELAIIYHNIGSMYKKRGMLDEAFSYLQTALEINTDLEQYEEIASNHYMIASIHSKRGDYDAARTSIDLALSFDKRVENSIGIAKDLFARGMIEEKAGNDDQAYRNYEKSFQVYQAMYLYKSAADVLPYLIAAGERLGKDEEVHRYRELEKQLQGS